MPDPVDAIRQEAADLKQPSSQAPKISAPASPLEAVLQRAKKDLGDNPHPEVLGAYLVASSNMEVARQLASLRAALVSGEVGLTVGLDKPT